LRPTTAVSAFYFLFFGGIGVFWPVYVPFLERLGLSTGEAGTILSLNPLMGFVTPLLFGLLADAMKARVWILRVLSAGSAVAFAGWLVAEGSPALIWITAITYAMCRAPLGTLVDASAFEAVRAGGGSFGAVRLWGSVGFFVAAIAGGLLFEHVGPRAMVAGAVAGLGAAAAFTWRLPAPPVERVPGALRAWQGMLRPDLVPYLAAVFLGYVANSALDTCFSARLERLGAGGAFIALAWGVGVLAEVWLMWRSQEIIARIGADRLLAIALGTAAVRWALLAFVTSRSVLLALQPLHGVTFGCMYVAGATIVRQRAPDEAPTSAQGLFNATAAAGAFAGMNVAGRAFERFGPRALFLGAAAIATLATACALTYARLAPTGFSTRPSA
jgi:PPP family 3-phenylpropionic acid transporter